MKDKYSVVRSGFEDTWKNGSVNCRKDTKHESFEMIFVCLERDCPESYRAICA